MGVIMKVRRDKLLSSYGVILSGGSISYLVWRKIKGVWGFPCLLRGNVEVLGRDKAENIPVPCDGHIKREVQGGYRGEVAHDSFGGCDRLRYQNNMVGYYSVILWYNRRMVFPEQIGQAGEYKQYWRWVPGGLAKGPCTRGRVDTRSIGGRIK